MLDDPTTGGAVIDEALVHPGLLEMDHKGFFECFLEQRGDHGWVRANFHHYKRIQDNSPSDLSGEQADRLRIVVPVLQGTLQGMDATEKKRLAEVQGYNAGQAVDIDLDIEEKEIYDLDSFEERVNDLFLWTESIPVRERFLAPHFVVLQQASAGMGKTRLLHEYKERMKKKDDTMVVKLLLCSIDGMAKRKSVVHEELLIPGGDPSEEKMEAFTGALEDMVGGTEGKKVVLLVDDAHHLLWRLDSHKGYYFRCFRHWLRLYREGYQVVAVLAGTNLKLCDAFKEPRRTRYSRDGPSPYHEEDGTELYGPFLEKEGGGSVALT
jgi:hypothetical protein